MTCMLGLRSAETVRHGWRMRMPEPWHITGSAGRHGVSLQWTAGSLQCDRTPPSIDNPYKYIAHLQRCHLPCHTVISSLASTNSFCHFIESPIVLLSTLILQTPPIWFTLPAYALATPLSSFIHLRQHILHFSSTFSLVSCHHSPLLSCLFQESSLLRRSIIRQTTQDASL